jgi:hypothetical protein
MRRLRRIFERIRCGQASLAPVIDLPVTKPISDAATDPE